MQKMIDYLVLYPKRLFFIDGVGALLTAFLLGVVLANFEAYFGMPRSVLTVLSMVALAFAVYSMSCARFVGSNWRFLLKIIAVANLLYCGTTVGLIICFYPQLTLFGIIYFAGEIGVILGLVRVEWKVMQVEKVSTKG